MFAIAVILALISLVAVFILYKTFGLVLRLYFPHYLTILLRKSRKPVELVQIGNSLHTSSISTHLIKQLLYPPYPGSIWVETIRKRYDRSSKIEFVSVVINSSANIKEIRFRYDRTSGSVEGNTFDIPLDTDSPKEYSVMTDIIFDDGTHSVEYFKIWYYPQTFQRRLGYRVFGSGFPSRIVLEMSTIPCYQPITRFTDWHTLDPSIESQLQIIKEQYGPQENIPDDLARLDSLIHYVENHFETGSSTIEMDQLIPQPLRFFHEITARKPKLSRVHYNYAFSVLATSIGLPARLILLEGRTFDISLLIEGDIFLVELFIPQHNQYIITDPFGKFYGFKTNSGAVLDLFELRSVFFSKMQKNLMVIYYDCHKRELIETPYDAIGESLQTLLNHYFIGNYQNLQYMSLTNFIDAYASFFHKPSLISRFFSIYVKTLFRYFPFSKKRHRIFQHIPDLSRLRS